MRTFRFFFVIAVIATLFAFAAIAQPVQSCSPSVTFVVSGVRTQYGVFDHAAISCGKSVQGFASWPYSGRIVSAVVSGGVLTVTTDSYLVKYTNGSLNRVALGSQPANSRGRHLVRTAGDQLAIQNEEEKTYVMEANRLKSYDNSLQETVIAEVNPTDAMSFAVANGTAFVVENLGANPVITKVDIASGAKSIFVDSGMLLLVGLRSLPGDSPISIRIVDQR